VVDSFSIRRTALSNDIPYYTTIAGARATLRAIDNLKRGALAVRPVQEYLGDEY
jgi:carbamoyl-phosphate synthase large subunit